MRNSQHCLSRYAEGQYYRNLTSERLVSLSSVRTREPPSFIFPKLPQNCRLHCIKCKMSRAQEDPPTKITPCIRSDTFNSSGPHLEQPAAEACQFFNVATTSANAESPSCAYEGAANETWLPHCSHFFQGNPHWCPPPCECGDCEQASSEMKCVAQSLGTQVQALVCGNATAAPTSELAPHRLIATVRGHAMITSAIARQYACATRATLKEACQALAICSAQCSRLLRAREVYRSSLQLLSMTHACSSHACSAPKEVPLLQNHCACFKKNIIRDLADLEELRSRAGFFQDSRNLREWMELNKQHAVYSQEFGGEMAIIQEELRNFLAAEKAALQLFHVSASAISLSFFSIVAWEYFRTNKNWKIVSSLFWLTLVAIYVFPLRDSLDVHPLMHAGCKAAEHPRHPGSFAAQFSGSGAFSNKHIETS